MKFGKKSVLVAALAITVMGLGSAGVWAAADADDQEKDVTIEQVPAPVRAAIEAETKGAKDLKISSETDDGFTVFEAEFEMGGVKKSIDVTDGGVITERESAASAASVPKAVTEKLLAEHPKAQVKEVVEVVSTYYEVKVDVGGKEKEFKVFANGQEVECED